MNYNMTYRCPDCKQCWPNDFRFKKCPECPSKACWHKQVGPADTLISLDDALLAKAYADFDSFYASKVRQDHEKAINRLSTADPLYVGDIVDFG